MRDNTTKLTDLYYMSIELLVAGLQAAAVIIAALLALFGAIVTATMATISALLVVWLKNALR